MARQQKTQRTSVEGQVKAFKTLKISLAPNMPLNDRQREHYDRILTSRESTSWNPHDISMACQLALMIDRFEKVEERLKDEGETVFTDKGTMTVHPLVGVSCNLSTKIMLMTRALGLTANQRGLTGDDQEKRNAADVEAKVAIDKAASEADNLLA